MAIDISSIPTSSSTAPAVQPTEVVSNGFTAPNLTKNVVVNLQKAEPTLTGVYAGLGWDVDNRNGQVDLDLTVFALHQNGKIATNDDFLFHDQQLVGPGLQKSSDNRTGAGDGDDEWLKIDFANVKPTVDRIVLVVNIYEAAARRQTFGAVRNAKLHIDDINTGRTLATFALTDDYSVDASVTIGEFVRSTEGWAFHAIGEGSTGEIGDFLQKYQP